MSAAPDAGGGGAQLAGGAGAGAMYAAASAPTAAAHGGHESAAAGEGSSADADANGDARPAAVDWGDKEARLRELLSCGVCKDVLHEAVTIAECMHSFCRKCIEGVFTQQGALKRRGHHCPTCNQALPNAFDITHIDESLEKIAAAVFPARYAERAAAARAAAAQNTAEAAAAWAAAAMPHSVGVKGRFAVPTVLAPSQRNKRPAPAARPRGNRSSKRRVTDGDPHTSWAGAGLGGEAGSYAQARPVALPPAVPPSATRGGGVKVEVPAPSPPTRPRPVVETMTTASSLILRVRGVHVPAVAAREGTAATGPSSTSSGAGGSKSNETLVETAPGPTAGPAGEQAANGQPAARTAQPPATHAGVAGGTAEQPQALSRSLLELFPTGRS